MCGLELNAVNRRRDDDQHRYQPGSSVYVSRGVDVRTIARQLPRLQGFDREGSDDAWTQMLRTANEFFLHGTTVRRNGALTIPSVEETLATMDGVRRDGTCIPHVDDPASASHDVASSASGAANRRAQITQEAHSRAATINDALDEVVIGGGSAMPLVELTAAMEERPESIIHDACQSLGTIPQGLQTVGGLAPLLWASLEGAGVALEAVGIPLDMAAAVVCGLEGLGNISLEADRVGVANGYADALREYAYGAATASHTAPEEATPEYQRGWTAAARYLEGLRADNDDQYLLAMRAIWRIDRMDLFNAAYGEGIYRQTDTP